MLQVKIMINDIIYNHTMKLILILIVIITITLTLDNGLGKTPPMGWNSWNHFGCNINQALIRETVDLLISTGLAAKGYKYVNLDDCWQIERNISSKKIIEDKTKFPSGIANLSAYVHSKGLLFGLYSDAGTKTCQGRPGSYGFEQIDANTYAEWKIDYLKYDNCHNEGISPKFRYPLMRDALNKTGRPIYFSMCEWGRENPAKWAKPVANSWRTTIDIKDIWLSFVHNLERQVGLSVHAGPGAWNDPDMLEVGNGGMNQEEYQSHFSLWAALKSPLLIGCALKTITNATLSILGNEQIIAINQDPLGKQADLIHRQIYDVSYKQIWGGQLSNNRFVLVFLNRADVHTVFKFQLDSPELRGMKVIRIRDVVDHSEVTLPSSNTLQTKTVKPHGVANYVLTLGPKEIDAMI